MDKSNEKNLVEAIKLLRETKVKLAGHLYLREEIEKVENKVVDCLAKELVRKRLEELE